MMKINIVTCPRPKCGHEWITKVANPVQCPRCHCSLPKQSPHDAFENHDELRSFPRKPSDSDGEEVTK